jgi:hypothetical protein
MSKERAAAITNSDNVSKSAFGVDHGIEKAYTPGAITLHHEQAQMHARKKTSGKRQLSAGATVAVAGQAARRNSRQIGNAVRDLVSAGDGGVHQSLRAERAGVSAARIARRFGPEVAAGGLALAATGATRAVYHGHKQNAEVKAAQKARRQRAASLKKSAFGVEHDEIGKGRRADDFREGFRSGREGARDRLEMAHWKRLPAARAAAHMEDEDTRGVPFPGVYLKHSASRRRGGKLGAAVGAAEPRRKVSKAFDSERQRHRRQEAYEGATAGGAALTGGVAARTGRAARQTRKEANRLAAEARATHIDVQRALHRMAQPTGSAGNLANTKPNVSAAAHLHRQAVDQNREALGVAHHARQLGRRGKLTAITSASLAATSCGLHRHDRKGGSSYSYR